MFVDAYLRAGTRDPGFAERMPFHVVNDRMKIWAHFTQPGVEAPWLQGKNFRGWAQPMWTR